MTARDAVNLADIERLARDALDAATFDYFAGGAGDEVTLRDNGAAFERLAFRPRVLAGVGDPDTSVELFGHRLALPVLLAPVALNALAHTDAERAAAGAASACGSAMVVSTFASCPLEEIASAAASPLWFQTYVFHDRGVTRALIERAMAARYRAVVVTADVPRIGRRERDVRNRFVLPPGIGAGNLLPHGRPPVDGPPLDDLQRLVDASLTWADVTWVRRLCAAPLLVKGILTAEDARSAIDAGADGIIVSNHGGRQLDGSVAAIDALPEVVEAVAGRCPVLIDSGVRRGTDVLKAIALGAAATLIGRPYVWGLAVAGEAGVRRVIEMLHAELTLAMALAGCASLRSLPAALIVRRDGTRHRSAV